MDVFELYKPGQGTYARVTAAVLLGLTAAFGALELYSALEAWEATIGGVMPWKLLVPALVAIAAALGIAWIVNGRRSVDFLIVTEAELRKVSWPTPRQLRQQTVVVLVTTFLLGLIIFLVDLLFAYWNMAFFIR